MKNLCHTLLLVAVLVGSNACYGVPDADGAAPQALTRTGTGTRPPTTNIGVSGWGQGVRATIPDAGRTLSVGVTSGQQYTTITAPPATGCVAQGNSEKTIVDGDCTYTVWIHRCENVPLADGTQGCKCEQIVTATSGNCTRVIVGAG